jgi:1-aminocyclopropane-1-carboxylate deaminase/D-cysteine desulfhydrase-like pyridoxal-dependent ACC family enzyme
VSDALEHGADCLVTGGGAQSNHARATAAVARMAGLDCELVLAGPADPTGNVLLDTVLGASITWLEPGLSYDELELAIERRQDELQVEGRRPYGMPIGGSSPRGASAYAAAALELTEQLDPELVVVASGSGGTHAGLVAGFGDHARVHGVDVGIRPDLAAAIEALATEAAQAADLPAPTGACRLDRGQIGRGYGAPMTMCATRFSRRREPKASCSTPSTPVKRWRGCSARVSPA